MTRIILKSATFDFSHPSGSEYTEFYLLHVLEALTRAGEEWLRLHPGMPKLFESGVRYDDLSADREEWQDIPTTLARMKGDCKDLASWYAAEVRHRGGKARCFIRWRRNKRRVLYHVLVLVTLQDGRRVIVDPSRKLGMGQ